MYIISGQHNALNYKLYVLLQMHVKKSSSMLWFRGQLHYYRCNKMQPLISLINNKFQMGHNSEEKVLFSEVMIPFRGGKLFHEYIYCWENK